MNSTAQISFSNTAQRVSSNTLITKLLTLVVMFCLGLNNLAFAQSLPTAPLPKDGGSSTMPSDKSAPAPERPVVAIEAVKMNVFYIGVDNPLRVAASGVPSKELHVQLVGNGTLTGSEGKYNVVVTQPGEITVRVSRKIGDEIKFIVDQKYRVKRIPDPSPRLDGLYRAGGITKDQLLNSKSVVALMENFDFDAACEVSSFELTILPKGQDPITLMNTGAALSANAKERLGKLEGIEDAVFIDEIKVKCPGDGAVRNLGGMALKVRPDSK